MCFRPNYIQYDEERQRWQYMGPLMKYGNTSSRGTEQYIKAAISKNEIAMIPCRKCLSCRITHAANWAARCEVETLYHEENHFVTLTYSPEDVPVYNSITKENYRGIKEPERYAEEFKKNRGETTERLSLHKKDMQDFFKRLRITAQRAGYEEEGGIKVYYCGEYGGRTIRPHYHCIIYGLHIPDLKLKYRKKGYEHDTSEWLERLWGHGMVDVAGVSYQACNYVARYVVKKYNDGNRKNFKEAGIEPEFQISSQKPSIGYKYWLDHRDEIYSEDKMYLAQGRVLKPPCYYDTIEDKLRLYEENPNIDIEVTDEEERRRAHSTFMKELKRERRKQANDALFEKLKNTSLSMSEYFAANEQSYENRHKTAIKRDTV